VETNARVVMQMTNDADEQIARGPGDARILLVGDVKRAFPDAGDVNGTRYEVCADPDDAIDAVENDDFTAIAVVISAIPARLSATLKDLKDRCDTKIILLAQMYEEPLAIRLVNTAYDGVKLAQGYLICPVRPDTLYESVAAPDGAPSQRTSVSEPGKQMPHRVPMPVETITQTKPGRETPIAERREREALAERIRHLERLATEDDLTGLKNRRYIGEFAHQIVERAKKEDGQVTLLMFDIDDFKRYNDQYGHATGDDILRQAGVLVRRCCRGHDVVGRIGGDEFAVVFWDDPSAAKQRTDYLAPGFTGGSKDGNPTSDRRSASADHPTEVLAIAKRFIEELEKAELSSLDGLGPEGKGVLTISGGLATFPRDAQSCQELFLQADKALLEAKRSGKNRIYLVGKPAGEDEADGQCTESDITDIEA
jgi:GGDEF domain-containing protein